MPTRDRLARLGRRQDALCSAEDGVESAEHLFTACTRTQVAWAWARRNIIHLMPVSNIYPSDFELIHFEPNTMEKEIVWLMVCMGSEEKAW